VRSGVRIVRDPQDLSREGWCEHDLAIVSPNEGISEPTLSSNEELNVVPCRAFRYARARVARLEDDVYKDREGSARSPR
jgi:hypothetical protein